MGAMQRYTARSNAKQAQYEKLSPYQQTMAQATGIMDPVKLNKIEDIMRDVIFHSTLDWQTAAQLRKAAKQAALVLAAMEGDGDGDNCG